MDTLRSCCQWLEGTTASVYIRESTWSYPFIESTHVLGLCLFIGFLLFWDLRLVGVILRRVPVSEVWRRLIPWIARAAAVVSVLLWSGVGIMGRGIGFY